MGTLNDLIKIGFTRRQAGVIADQLVALSEGGARGLGPWETTVFVSDISLGAPGSALPAGIAQIAGAPSVRATPAGAGQPADATSVYIKVVNGVKDTIEVTVPAGVVEMRYHLQISTSEGGPAVVNVTKNGQSVSVLSGVQPWTQRSIPVAPGDKVRFEAFSDVTYRLHADVTNFEFYTAAESYMRGDPVIYQGAVYISGTDNNLTVPGASDSAWLRQSIRSTAGINPQTGTAYTLVGADTAQLVTRNNAAASTLTVPSGVFSAGQSVIVANLGAGVVTVTPGSGVTVNSAVGLTVAQHAVVTLLALSPTSFLLTSGA